MEFHQWQQQLRKELKLQRVPEAYANRLMEELYNHYLDIQEEAMNHSTTPSDNNVIKMMGDPKSIALAAAQLPKRSWVASHPLLSYLILPPVMSLAVLAILLTAEILLLAPVLKGRTLQSDSWIASACMVFGPLQVIVATSVIAIWACRSVARNGRSKIWVATACLALAVLGAYTSVTFTPPQAGPGSGNLSLGLSFPFPVSWYQALAPILVAGIFYVLRPKHPVSSGNDMSSTFSQAA